LGEQSSGNYMVGRNNQILTDGTNNYAYDAEGNMISRSNIVASVVTFYQFDHRNRLVRVADRNSIGVITQTVTFSYDTMNRRIARSVDGDVAYFLLNQENAWADTDEAGANITHYLLGNRTDEMLARYSRNRGVNWYLTDNVGTVGYMTDSLGVSIRDIRYDSFGRVLGQSEPGFVDRFLFTGREFDHQTGLYFYRARYYNPDLGRFLSTDPIGFSALDFNLYRYGRNQPGSLTDPSGQISILSYVVSFTAGLTLASTVVLTALEPKLRELHSRRNRWNVCPKTKDEFIFLGYWTKRSWLTSLLHENEVWMAPDIRHPGSSFECEYNGAGKYVSGGTYDFFDYGWDNPLGFLGHLVFDFGAHILYGGHYEDSTQTTP
jgi:RHS repeat-associated protein